MAVARGDVAAIQGFRGGAWRARQGEQGSALRGGHRGHLLAWRARLLPLLGAERRHARGQVERSRAASSVRRRRTREGKAAGGVDLSATAGRGKRRGSGLGWRRAGVMGWGDGVGLAVRAGQAGAGKKGWAREGERGRPVQAVVLGWRGNGLRRATGWVG
ncbi:hypothetical protein PVAP13_2KG225216 [Panicum virgatum]|uniref:Uncharacterized protein n=1 Tax=Panicum virgatum TaxID=38727 RepID=A0A8T0W8J7_PANVG|nr:hypothetical protein PVAP13_2KG225216 [Panicum virgatum]